MNPAYLDLAHEATIVASWAGAGLALATVTVTSALLTLARICGSRQW